MPNLIVENAMRQFGFGFAIRRALNVRYRFEATALIAWWFVTIQFGKGYIKPSHSRPVRHSTR